MAPTSLGQIVMEMFGAIEGVWNTNGPSGSSFPLSLQNCIDKGGMVCSFRSSEVSSRDVGPGTSNS